MTSVKSQPNPKPEPQEQGKPPDTESDAYERALAQLSSMRHIAAVLASADSLEEACRASLDSALETLGWDVGMVHLRDEPTSGFKLLAWRGLSRAAATRVETLTPEEAPLAWLADDTSPTVVASAESNPRWEALGLHREQLGFIAVAAIRVEGEMVGTLVVGDRSEQPPTELDLLFLEGLALQTGVCAQRLRLRQAYEENLLELNALYSVSRQVDEQSEIAAVLESFRKSLKTVLGITRCAVYSVDETGKHLRCVAWHGIPDSLVRVIEEHSHRGPFRKALNTGEPIILRKLEDYNGHPSVSELAQEYQIQSALLIPVLIGRHGWGILSLYDTKPRDWSPSEVRLGQMLAGGIAAALTNIEHYRSLSQFAERLQRLHKVSTQLMEAEYPERVAVLATESGLALLRADVVALHSYDSQYGVLKLLSAHPPHATCVPSVVLPGRGFQGKALRDGVCIARPVRLARAGFDGFAAAIPLKSGEDQVGVLSVYRDRLQGPFSDEEVEFKQLFASIVATAMHNARLFTRSEELGITRERNRIAREMHDTLGSEMASLLKKVELVQVSLEQNPSRAKEELARIHEGLQHTIAELRRLLAALRPLTLEQDGLLASMRRLVKDFEDQASVPVTFTVEGNLPSLSPRVETTLFRVLQECTTNIHKHAQASSVAITLCMENRQLFVTIEDNGLGCDTSRMEAQGGMGLRNIRSRVEAAGGRLEIVSAPDQGTRIRATFPVSQAPEG